MMSSRIDEAIEVATWIKNPSRFHKYVFREVPYPYQATVLNDLAKLNPKRILCCSAGGTGKTKILASLGLYSAYLFPLMFPKIFPHYRVVIVSGSDEQSRTLYEFIKFAIEENAIINKAVKDTLKTITTFKNRSTIRALPKSFKAIYGKHADLVIIDEAVEAGDFVIRDAFRIIAESPNSRIIISSTPHEYTSLFVDMWDNKKKYPEYNPILKEVGSWKRYSWSSFDCPRITQDMIKEAQKDLPSAMFNVYWLGKPYPMIGTMIPIEKVKASITTNNIIYDKDGVSPTMGVDWGTFPNPTAIILVQKNSDGVFNVLSTKTFLRGRHPAILDWIDAKARSFNVSNIFTDSSDKGENLRLREKGLPVREISFKREKPIMQSNLLNIFEKENIKIHENEVKLLWQMKKYRYDTKLDEDLVDALMLACRMGDRRASKMYYKFIKPNEAKRTFF